jgi:DUF3024 family protein
VFNVRFGRFVPFPGPRRSGRIGAVDPQDVDRVAAWCLARVPEDVRDQLRVECEVGHHELTIVERHPPLPGIGGTAWTREPVARLRCAKYLWTLYWCNRDQRFRRYSDLAPTTDVGVLLAEIDRDPGCVFWG